MSAQQNVQVPAFEQELAAITSYESGWSDWNDDHLALCVEKHSSAFSTPASSAPASSASNASVHQLGHAVTQAVWTAPKNN